MANPKKLDATEITALILAASTLLLVLYKGLLAALFAGMLVNALIHLITPMLGTRISGGRAKMLVVAAIGAAVIAVLTLTIWASVSFFRSDAGSLQSLMQRLADIIQASRGQLPVWLTDRLPVEPNALSEVIVHWLREHALEAKTFGAEAGRTAAHVLIGMIIGAMVALHDVAPKKLTPPLAAALETRLIYLSDAFQNIVFAQVRISAINTAITAVFLLIILPMGGIHLPLSKSLIAITFFAGLLPVVGNLISNSVLVIVALSHSLHTASAALIFMIVLHKLEYFLNARIIGSHINARAWELLVVLLAMEAVFGISGVIAGPVFYAYLKKELMARELV